MKQSGNDNYDLNTSSPQGHAGFEAFRTDKHFYFHFNDEAGETILFSQAYKTKKGRDNGMKSIKKNIKNKAHLIFHHEDDLHYFSIKAGNNQEVTRSRNYESKEEMLASISYLYQEFGVSYQVEKKENSQQIIIELKENLTEQKEIETELREKIWELETTLAETSSSLNESLLQKEIWIKEKEEIEAKMVILAKRSSDLQEHRITQNESSNYLANIPTTNFSFLINFYNVDKSEDIKMVIYHPMTKDKKIIQGFDKEAMIDFMVSKLPSTILPLITEDIEKELDATKISETVIVARNTPNKEVTLAQKTANIPTIDKELETLEIKKEATNFQMKALVEATKSSDMSITKPAITTKEIQIENTPEEVAIINTFFGQTIKEVPTTKIAIEEAIENSLKNVEDTEIKQVQVEDTAEELAIIKQFFTQEVKEVPPIKKIVGKEIESNHPNLELIERINPEEEKIILQFFPNREESLKENLALAENRSTLLEASVEKNKENKNSPPKILDIIDPQLEVRGAEEQALIEQFFPPKIKSPKEEEIAAQIDIDKILNKVSEELEKNSAEEIAIINKFFAPATKKEKKLLPKPLDLNLFPADAVSDNHQEEQATIAQFFGKQSKAKNEKRNILEQDEFIASLLSNVGNEAIKERKNQESINQFFGKKFQKTIAEDKAPQTQTTNASSEDIKLYNKFFGKNISVERSSSCRI